jgi:uncharacterized membrane protein
VGWDVVRDFFAHHRGKFFGSLLGLVLAVMIMRLGFLWTLFITAVVAAGYLVGKHFDDEQDNLLDVLTRLLPPGGRR